MRARMRAVSSLFLVLASTVAAGPRQALAAWPHDPRINVALSTTPGSLRFPQMVSDGAGGAIVVWQDLEPSGPFNFNIHDIHAQRIDGHGNPVWTMGGAPVCTQPGRQQYPVITSDGAGGAIFAWEDQRSGPSQIYSQSTNAVGVVQWQTDGVVPSPSAQDQYLPTIASDGAGGAFLTWQSRRTGFINDIYAQRVNSAGAPLWSAGGVAIGTANGDKGYPVVVPDGGGGAIITWQDERGADYDVYVQRLSATGVPQWTPDGLALCTAAGNQYSPLIVPDGSGGAIVTWQDFRSGSTWDIYAQRVSAAGAPLWTTNGVPVSIAAGNQLGPVIASDGFGGAFVAWTDYRGGAASDIYAQHLDTGGTGQWTVDGLVLCSSPGNQTSPSIVSDGAGGAIVAWQDERGGSGSDIFAQRVNAAGLAQWLANGSPVCTDPSSQYTPVMAPDGKGGAIVAWDDSRGPSTGTYAQWIDCFGALGDAEPIVTSILDTPNDQGGSVNVSWNASYLDSIGVTGVASYEIDRSGPPSYAWQAVSTAPAIEQTTYVTSAPTSVDSSGQTNPRTSFRVRAISAVGPAHWDSAPDSGYSVDNLPPGAPGAFTGAYIDGATHLRWSQNGEPDFAIYHLYRGADEGFVPGASSLIASQPDTGYSDNGPEGSFYKLSAIDIHGNESAFALLTPGSTLAVGGRRVPRLLALAPPRPNPARNQTVLSFALPRDELITLAVYGMDGRKIRTIRAGQMGPGEYQMPLDLRDGLGRLIPSGIYFVRLEGGGRTLVRRLAILN